MPPKASTSTDKAEKERESVKISIAWLEQRLTDNSTTPHPESKINHYLSSVAANQKKIEDTFQRIVEIVDPTDLDDHAKEYTDLLDRVLELDHQFGLLKKKFTVIIPQHATPTADLRLPKLTLQTFDGNLNDWMPFHDMFTSAVHNNVSLSDSQKLTYLKGQLKGEAARQIQSIQISDANYDIAWKQLTNRYQNDREIFCSLMKKLHDQPNVQPNSSSSLRQLLDVSRECVRSLEVLKLPVHHWGAHLWFIIARKMDATSKELWEQSLKDSSIPTLQTLYDFLEQRARALAATVSSKPAQRSSNSHNEGNNGNKSHHNSNRNVTHHAQSSSNCKFCSVQSHPPYRCPTFLGWSAAERSVAIKKSRLCYNCMKEDHEVANCPSSFTCRNCSGKHHTLLHRNKPSNSEESTKNSDSSASGSRVHLGYTSNQFQHPSTASVHHTIKPKIYDTLLATIAGVCQDINGRYLPARILSDTGANSHYITESCLKKLGLTKRRCIMPSTGLGDEPLITAKAFTWVSVSPYFDQSIKYTIKALVLPKITGDLPITSYDHTHLQNLRYADPHWHTPGPIDILLGAEVSFDIIQDGSRVGPPGAPKALNSSFGWLIGGGSQNHATTSSNNYHTISDSNQISEAESLDKTLRRFWEIEEIPINTRILTKEERFCEEYFSRTIQKGSDGKFIVKIPFKDPRPQLGSSLEIAVRRLKQLERRLNTNTEAKAEYIKFLREYLDLGHMVEVPPPPSDADVSKHYYIPHHFVTKPDSTTTKFRVVFDASAKTSNGVSLNDSMMTGPMLQDTLVNIIFRFRLHEIVFVADVAKMYRQVWIDPSETDFQRIVWREDPALPVKHFSLQTVTYGSGCGTFLATKALQAILTFPNEIISKFQGTLPLQQVAEMILRDFYVDDLISGASNEKEALEILPLIIQLLKSAGFPLRKWSSNSQSILNALPTELRETQSVLEFDSDSTIKTLGICWNPTTDSFTFKIKLPSRSDKPLTKRRFLSELAAIFDPIGWLSPVLISGKILMQSVHQLKNGWDDILPTHIQQQWASLVSGLSLISGSPRLDVPVAADLSQVLPEFNIKSTTTSPEVPLKLSNPSPAKYYLVGFSDSSELAYSAVIYFCAYLPNHPPSIEIVTSKTRVKPLKTISLPRLELCGALLLAELMPTVQSAIPISFENIYANTDSTIVLGYIRSHPSKWSKFVANRVTRIQNCIDAKFWGYVRGTDNPADCPSRGIDATSLINHSLWWHGPPWLKDGPQSPSSPSLPNEDELPDRKKESVCHFVMNSFDESLLKKYSSLTKLLRVTAFVNRFINCALWKVAL